MATVYPLPGGGHIEVHTTASGNGSYRTEPVTREAWQACIGMRVAPMLHGVSVVGSSVITELLRPMMDTVPPRTLKVLLSRARGRTLDETGRQLGLTRERIRQIERTGLRDLFRDRAASTRLQSQINQWLDETGGTLVITEDSQAEPGWINVTQLLPVALNSGSVDSSRPPVHWRWTGNVSGIGALSTLPGAVEERIYTAEQETGDDQRPPALILSRVSYDAAEDLGQGLSTFQIWLDDSGAISTAVLEELISDIKAWGPGSEPIPLQNNINVDASAPQINALTTRRMQRAIALIETLQNDVSAAHCTARGYLIAAALMAPHQLRRHADGSTSSRKNAYGAVSEAASRLNRAGFPSVHASVLGVIVDWALKGKDAKEGEVHNYLSRARLCLHLQPSAHQGEFELRQCVTRSSGSRVKVVSAMMLQSLRSRGLARRYDELMAEAERQGVSLGEHWKIRVVNEMQAQAKAAGEVLEEGAHRILHLTGAPHPQADMIERNLRRTHAALMTRSGAQEGRVSGEDLWPGFPEPPAQPPAWLEAELVPYVLALTTRGWILSHFGGQWTLAERSRFAADRLTRSYYGQGSKFHHSDVSDGLERIAKEVTPKVLGKMIEWARQESMRASEVPDEDVYVRALKTSQARWCESGRKFPEGRPDQKLPTPELNKPELTNQEAVCNQGLQQGLQAAMQARRPAGSQVKRAKAPAPTSGTREVQGTAAALDTGGAKDPMAPRARIRVRP